MKINRYARVFSIFSDKEYPFVDDIFFTFHIANLITMPYSRKTPLK